jgi:AcrR family transcriptional regulator
MRAEARRRQLLEVSADLFAQHGYRGTTTAELAKAAQVTEPILYRHFKNKLDLFVTLVDEVGHEVLDAWRESLSEVDDPGQRLEILLAGNPATHERGKGVYRVIFQAMTEIGRDPDIAKPLRRHLTRLHGFLREELETMQEQGAVRNDEPASALAWMLINIAIGYGMSSPLGLPGQGGGTGRLSMETLLAEMLTKSA